MIRFPRQPEPSFWGGFERWWLYEAPPKARPLHDKRREGRTPADWFHALVRPAAAPRNYAYCDGRLLVESGEAIDHFIPLSSCRNLGLTWANLYPACDHCNTKAKRTKASCWLVRPDADPVDDWIDYDEQTGRLEPAPHVDRATRLRIRRTLQTLRLNTTERTKIRRDHYRMLLRCWMTGDNAYLDEAAKAGPYRFVARKFLASKKPVGVLV
jgi:uncharacterized protein (TIGR02646 family)